MSGPTQNPFCILKMSSPSLRQKPQLISQLPLPTELNISLASKHPSMDFDSEDMMWCHKCHVEFTLAKMAAESSASGGSGRHAQHLSPGMALGWRQRCAAVPVPDVV